MPKGRSIEHLIANAGRGLGDAFLNHTWADAKFVAETNIIGTIYLLHELGRKMVEVGNGRILITGSRMGQMAAITEVLPVQIPAGRRRFPS